jgi:hypothetical protein
VVRPMEVLFRRSQELPSAAFHLFFFASARLYSLGYEERQGGETRPEDKSPGQEPPEGGREAAFEEPIPSVPEDGSKMPSRWRPR